MNNLESELGCNFLSVPTQGVTSTDSGGRKRCERVAVAYEQLRTVEEELVLSGL